MTSFVTRLPFCRCAADYGVGKGDRVIVYMPMIPEAVISMLACARIGAIHSVVFGGFAAKELATRVVDASPKLVVSASCGIEGKRVIPYLPLLEKALESPVLRICRESWYPGRSYPSKKHIPRLFSGTTPWQHAHADCVPLLRLTRSTSCTPPAQPANPRVWCDPMVGMPLH